MKRSKDRATRILALFLMGLLCLGLAACGTVTEADSSAVDVAEVTEVEEERVGATSLEVYFVLDEVTDEMTAYKINGGHYYISTEQAAAIAENIGEDFSFADADGNVIAITPDGSYSSDTGKALLKVVGVGDTFTDAEDMSLTVAVTEIVEEEAEEETEEETGEEAEEETEVATTASTSSSGDSSSSSGSSGNSSSSGGNSSSSSGSSNSTSYSVSIWSCSESGHAWNDGSYYYDEATGISYTKYKCMACGETKLEEREDTTSKSSNNTSDNTSSKNTTASTTTATTTAETTEEETECEHNWKKLLDREDKTEVVLCGCGEYFIVDDYGSYNAAVYAWTDHAFGDDCWGSYTSAYIYGTYYRCSKCRATKECSDTELNLVYYTGTRDSSSYVLAKDQS